MTLNYLHSIFFLLTLLSCQQENNILKVDASNNQLQLHNGILFYNKKPFSGHVIKEYEPRFLKSDIQYVNGKKEGYEKHWFQDGSPSVERFYINGLKTGIHKAWWPNGTLKFEYYFNDQGEYHGVVKEWYKTGQPFRAFNYENGKERGRQHLWKLDGTIMANYEVVNGERFGLIGLKKCFTVTVDSDEVK